MDLLSYSFSGTGTYLNLVAHSYLLNKYPVCEPLEGRGEGFIITVNFPSCLVQGWAYSRPRIEYIKLVGALFYFAAVICFLSFSDVFWKPLMEDPLESHKRAICSSSMEVMGTILVSPFCSWHS